MLAPPAVPRLAATERSAAGGSRGLVRWQISSICLRNHHHHCVIMTMMMKMMTMMMTMMTMIPQSLASMLRNTSQARKLRRCANQRRLLMLIHCENGHKTHKKWNSIELCRNEAFSDNDDEDGGTFMSCMRETLGEETRNFWRGILPFLSRWQWWWQWWGVGKIKLILKQ